MFVSGYSENLIDGGGDLSWCQVLVGPCARGEVYVAGVAQRVHLRNIMMRVVMAMVYSACTGVEAFKRESRQLCNFIQVKREKLKFDDLQRRSRMTLSPLYLFSSWTARSPPCLLA